MTAEEKIAEADYNLHKIRHLPIIQPEFKFELSNFLNSAQSIFWHLLEDFNIKFDLGLDYIDSKKFKEKAKELDNHKAFEFIQWYDNEYNKIKNNKQFGFLTQKRRLNVHKTTVMPNTFIVGDYTPRTFSGPGTWEIPINFNQSQTSFPENSNDDLKFVCVLFLTRIKQMVKDAHSKF